MKHVCRACGSEGGQRPSLAPQITLTATTIRIGNGKAFTTTGPSPRRRSRWAGSF
jgi:hypothetical protein